MSEKKEVRIICDRCGREIQSANKDLFRGFYVRNNGDLPGPLTEYKYAIRNRNTTCAVFHGNIEYIMRGWTVKTDNGMLDLCAECAESLNDWWISDGAAESPLAACGLEKAP